MVMHDREEVVARVEISEDPRIDSFEVAVHTAENVLKLDRYVLVSVNMRVHVIIAC